MTSPRLAARALIVADDRVLLVNAYPDGTSDLWCAPGGGVEAGTDLPTNLAREVREETGLSVAIGPLVLVNEFHAPDSGFHQVDLFFQAEVTAGDMTTGAPDPAGIVTERRFFTRAEAEEVRFKPDSLLRAAFETPAPPLYDGLERLVA